MKKRSIIGIFLLVTAVAALMFIGIVSASSGDKNGTNEVSAPTVGSTTFVISQANGGGGGSTGTYLFDYVELHNVSGTAQSLNGLSLYYGSSTGQFASATTNAYALANVSVPAGKYYLVQLGAAGTAGANLPVAPDETTTNLSMSATNGKVALVTAALAQNTCGATATPCTLPNAAIIDLVAWGAANNAEGGAATNGGAAITSSQGNVRKGGGVDNGCTDTDNNNADFDIITAPIPRNSASPAVSCSATIHTQHVMDFNGDGKTDFAVFRNIGGQQQRWYIAHNGTGTFNQIDWGLNGDTTIPADFDGDGKSDVAVWRAGAGLTSAFYIFNSSTSTVTTSQFGLSTDDATVVGDYDGDGKADMAVYRPGAAVGQQSTWFYRGSLNNPNGNITFVPWGVNGDKVAPGDYNGDGRADMVIARSNGSQFVFRTLLNLGANSFSEATPVFFGQPSDFTVPGDYDGDGKTDYAVLRSNGVSLTWFYIPSSANTTIVTIPWGSTGDFVVPGDYDGDGKTDPAIWRSGNPGVFWVQNSSNGATQVFAFGGSNDGAIGTFGRH